MRSSFSRSHRGAGEDRRRGTGRALLRRAAGPLALTAAAVGLGCLAFAPAQASSTAVLTSAQPKALPGSLLAAGTSGSSAKGITRRGGSIPGTGSSSNGVTPSVGTSGGAPGTERGTASANAKSSKQLSVGRTLFEETCSSCHGVHAQGSALAPNLRGLGAATVDLWVESGWMPLAEPTAQPIRKPDKFDRAQTMALANWVGSLAGGPAIPHPNLAKANVAEGMSVFALNCAPCHTISGAGDALSNGITAPSLHYETPAMVSEAIRTGPGNMPRFSAGTLSQRQVLDVVDYVATGIQHPTHPGGLALGGVGPVAEGFVGLFVGVGLCVIAAFWIGDRTPRDIDEQAAHGRDATHEPGSQHA